MKQRSRSKAFKWLNKGDARDVGQRNAGTVIAAIRKLRKWRQSDLARYVGVTTNHLAQVEKGRSRLSDARFELACEALEVSETVVTALGLVVARQRTLTANETLIVGAMFVNLFEDKDRDDAAIDV